MELYATIRLNATILKRDIVSIAEHSYRNVEYCVYNLKNSTKTK